jgi:hypothetical protein
LFNLLTERFIFIVWNKGGIFWPVIFSIPFQIQNQFFLPESALDIDSHDTFEQEKVSWVLFETKIQAIKM